MKNNQKKGITHSFQFQIIAYSLISMILTALTMLVLILAVYGIFILVRSESGQQETVNSGLNNYTNGLYRAENSIPAGAGNSSYMADAYTKEMPGSTEAALDEDIADEEELNIKIYGQAAMKEDWRHGTWRMKLSGGRIWIFAMIFLFLALFFFILYFLLLTRKFTAYLEKITGGIKKLATGEFDTRIEVRQSNELTEIASSFNRMAEELERIVNEERKNETAKNEMITSVAHDLRTPLTSVIGYLELVAEKNLEPETREHYVSVAYRKAKRMQNLIEDLFNFTQYGSGEVKMNLACIDAIKIMEQLLEEFYPNIQESCLELEVEKKTDSAMVDADGLLLARAFANLLGNAIKYGRDGKNLKVQMEKKENQAVLRIINFGEVIPEKDLENIFRRFYRVDSARTEAQGGAGLGLAIAKNIIELHQGTIAVKSDLDGTEFSVFLPLAEEPVQK